MIEHNEKFLSIFQDFLVKNYHNYVLKCNETIKLRDLINRTGKLVKDNSWKKFKVLDLSSMTSGNIFINNFSNGDNFSTNIKTINNFDLVYGSVRPYFKKAGFALDVKYIAGTVFSFNVINENDYLWILACIASEEFHSFTSINSQGTKMPIINWDTFVSYKIPYNSNIVKLFNEMLMPIFQICINKMRQNNNLRQIRQLLLNKYFQ